MSAKKTLITNTGINLATHAFLLVSSLISIPISLKYLGVESFGLLILITTVTNLAASIDLGITPATIMHLADSFGKNQKEKAKSYFQSATILIVAILVMLAVLSRPALNFINIPQDLILLVTILSLLSLSTSFASSLPQSRNNFLLYSVRGVLVGSGNTLITAFIAYKTASLPQILQARILMQVLALIVFKIYALKTFENISLSVEKKKFKHLLSFGYKKFLGLLSGQGVYHLPRILISKTLGEASLTLFAVPQGILSNIQAGITQLTTALYPLASHLKAKNKKDKVLRLVSKAQVLIASSFAVLVLTFSLYGQNILSLWLGNQSLASEMMPILVVLTVVYGLSALAALPATILDAWGKPEIPTKYSLLNLALQVVFLLTLVPTFGIMGAVYAILAHTAIQVPLFLIAFKKYSS